MSKVKALRPVLERGEVKLDGRWIRISIVAAVETRPHELRCAYCWGRVSPHQTGKNGSRAHFEHLPQHYACNPNSREAGKVPRHPLAVE
jgi:hypothetical protein